MVVSLAGASRLVWPLANSLSSYTHLDEYLPPDSRILGPANQQVWEFLVDYGTVIGS